MQVAICSRRPIAVRARSPTASPTHPAPGPLVGLPEAEARVHPPGGASAKDAVLRRRCGRRRVRRSRSPKPEGFRWVSERCAQVRVGTCAQGRATRAEGWCGAHAHKELASQGRSSRCVRQEARWPMCRRAVTNRGGGGGPGSGSVRGLSRRAQRVPTQGLRSTCCRRHRPWSKFEPSLPISAQKPEQPSPPKDGPHPTPTCDRNNKTWRSAAYAGARHTTVHCWAEDDSHEDDSPEFTISCA